MSRLQVLAKHSSIALAFLLSLHQSESAAQAGALDLYNGPGHYRVVGTLATRRGSLILRLFIGTGSEMEIPIVLPGDADTLRSLSFQLGSRLNRSVEVSGQIQRDPKHPTLTVERIRDAVPDPLDSSGGDGFWKD